MALLPNPIPMLNISEPPKHNITFIIVLLIGVAIGIIININIPIPNDIINESHSFCFDITHAKMYIDEKIPTKKTLDIIHIIILNIVNPSRVKGSPEITPPIIEPTKKAIIIDATLIKQTMVLDIT